MSKATVVHDNKIVTCHVAVQRKANMQVTDYTSRVYYIAVLAAVCPMLSY